MNGKKTYIDFEKCSIDRDHPEHPGGAVLVGPDKSVVYRFSDNLTDGQIQSLVAFANRIYAIGHYHGARDKAFEIRKALSLV